MRKTLTELYKCYFKDQDIMSCLKDDKIHRLINREKMINKEILKSIYKTYYLKNNITEALRRTNVLIWIRSRLTLDEFRSEINKIEQYIE